jgi:hypothetical protein
MGILGIVPRLYDSPWIVENRERHPGNTEDFLRSRDSGEYLRADADRDHMNNF